MPAIPHNMGEYVSVVMQTAENLFGTVFSAEDLRTAAAIVQAGAHVRQAEALENLAQALSIISVEDD